LSAECSRTVRLARIAAGTACCDFTANQMEAFSEMWIEPLEFIEVGDRLVAAGLSE
jgi:hypothetical protein